MRGELIGIDWGTTNCRAYLIAANGEVVARHEEASGILSVAPGGFPDAAARIVAALCAETPVPPILLSGMVGSRQGWQEAPYVACPAGAAAIVAGLVALPAIEGAATYLVPGLISEDESGMPDVLRGEEMQIFAAMTAFAMNDGLVVLPGTHSKWARIDGGRVANFATFMTGEVFAVLREHSILGRLMQPASFEEEGFARGVAAAQRLVSPGDLLHQLFATRSLGLTARLPAEALADYLSGLLIGAEIRAGVARFAADHFVLVASRALEMRYEKAAALIGIETRKAPADIIAGAYLGLARAAGLIGSQL